ncbi:MAG: zinc metallopeptidase [Bacillota bacterium]
MAYYGSYIVLLPFLLLTFYAQYKVKSTYKKYLKVGNQKNLSGFEVARRILDRNGLRDVKISQSRGELSDHYNPRSKQVNLSSKVYNGKSISSIAIAAHEVGHAIQHSKSYVPLVFRSKLAPIASISSKAVTPLIILGIIVGRTGFFDIGIMLFSAVLLFQLVTLPVEFNASKRALNQLTTQGLVYNDEQKKAKKVLNAAALTYVAALAVSVGQLIRLFILRGRD